ncbi:NACHT, LRR and PYD domains-containing protein 3-like [Pelmatolapia mariae]|uniref:NACHT, LRR and PYD domains-containing protein 3-like n=1 Tax=Pelmatolapia mariae TaxID=158779 RepID=UPI003211EE9E
MSDLESPGSSCLSVTDTKENSDVGVEEEEQLSCCALGQDVSEDSVSTSCGISVQTDVTPEEVLEEYKTSLRRRFESVTEETDNTGSGTLPNRIYTELYITEGQNEDVHNQHEVMQLETASKMEALDDITVRCHDIFKALPDQERPIRVVLTNGVAGIGKTFSVQKFTVDWAEGLENQDVSVVILLSFRELNLIRDEQYSLLELLHVFHPTLQKVTAEKLAVSQLLFIFDGLDESRLSLDFTNRKLVSDVTEKSSVSELLTNLIEGNLLPSALVWITSRPAAANQIPPTCVDRVTEVRGFTNDQKEEYFRRRFSDEELSRIISHMKTSRSLHIMCQIPVFCWITATVLEHMLTKEQSEELPKTLTDMYSHFLLVQMKKGNKHVGGHETSEMAERKFLLNLGRLAFEHLEKGNTFFYQEDLDQCGLDATEALLHTEVYKEIFKREQGILQKPVYCFIHQSIQEFLAAVYIFHCCNNRKTEVLDDCNSSLDVFLSGLMKKLLQSKNTHLDKFVRFLHGLTLESNQRLLGDLLGQTENGPEIIQRVINNLKEINLFGQPPARSINIFHCLMEMKDFSIFQQIHKKQLSLMNCSDLTYMLQMSDNVLEELDLKKYNTTEIGRQSLIPAVRNCKNARLAACGLSKMHCEIVASALKSSPSNLIELDLSGNNLRDSGVKQLFSSLESPNCRLETLRLSCCNLTDVSCDALSSALTSYPSRLKHLDLGGNKLHDSGVSHLLCFLKNPQCKLETLRLDDCGLSEISCASLVAAIKSNPSHLKHLDLSFINMKDSGMKKLCDFLESPGCRLETLSLRGHYLSSISCASLGSALRSNPSNLKHLDLSSNYNPEGALVKELCGFLENQKCKLETLRVMDCSLSEESCISLVSALKSNPSHLKHLDLSENQLQDKGFQQLCNYLENPNCELETLRLKGCHLSINGGSSLVSALKANPSHLKHLNLSENNLEDAVVNQLFDFVESPHYKLETLTVVSDHDDVGPERE